MTTANSLAELLGGERIAEQRKIGRYSLYGMLFRLDLNQHTRHVRLMVEATLPHLDAFILNTPLIRHFCDGHDDPEIYPKLGDVQAAFKALMTDREKKELEALEDEAMGYVIDRFGDVDLGGYTYSQMLYNYRLQLSPEAQIVHYIDKIAAFYEVMHELMAGNPDVITNKPDPKGRRTDHPFVGYPRKTHELIAARPFLAELQKLKEVAPFVAPAPGLPWLTLFKQGEPHTLDSVRQRAAKPGAGRNTAYSDWLKVILESGDDELIKALYVPNTRQFANCP